MNDYDSDSSDGEQAPYTETTTLLGYISNQPTGDCTKLGGLPAWINDTTPPSGQLAKCKVCNGFMVLLLQVSGDMPERFAGHERRLYILICRNKACRRKDGSVRSIRGSRLAKIAATPKPKAAKSMAQAVETTVKSVDIGATLFGARSSASSTSMNPFSGGTSTIRKNPFSNTPTPVTTKPPAESATESLPETFASKARLSSPAPPVSATPSQPQEAWPSSAQSPTQYPELLLDAEYETLSAPATPQTSKTISDIEMMGEGASNNSGGGGGAEDKELFESTMDKTFQRFADRIAANPEQVIRYEFGGSPLLYSDSDAVGKLLAADNSKRQGVTKITIQSQSAMSKIPRCSNCGAARVFEVQLTPHAITELEADDMSVDGMDWGTIIMAVCSADCALAPPGEVGYVEEWTGVQYEELVSKRNC